MEPESWRGWRPDRRPLFLRALNRSARQRGCVVATGDRHRVDMQRRAAALQLDREGVPRREIADRLGAAPSTVRGWLCDPDGSRARRRRATYGARCESCGARTSGNRVKAPRRCCRRCAGERLRRWPRPVIVARTIEWRREVGRWPRASDWHATRALERGGAAWTRWSSGRWPPASTVTRAFGRFDLAVDTARRQAEEQK